MQKTIIGLLIWGSVIFAVLTVGRMITGAFGDFVSEGQSQTCAEYHTKDKLPNFDPMGATDISHQTVSIIDTSDRWLALAIPVGSRDVQVKRACEFLSCYLPCAFRQLEQQLRMSVPADEDHSVDRFGAPSRLPPNRLLVNSFTISKRRGAIRNSGVRGCGSEIQISAVGMRDCRPVSQLDHSGMRPPEDCELPGRTVVSRCSE